MSAAKIERGEPDRQATPVCHEYMLDHNATQAAIRTGCSRKSAHSIRHENLK